MIAVKGDLIGGYINTLNDWQLGKLFFFFVKRQRLVCEFSSNNLLIAENVKVYVCRLAGWDRGEGEVRRTNIKRARNAEESASCTLARWWMGCGERLDVRQSGRVLPDHSTL